MNKLKKILEYKSQELASLKRKTSQSDYQKQAEDTEHPVPFLKNFNESDINIIAEIKKASPSAGVIRDDFNATDIANIYADNGAKSLSVLTDEHFFQGSLDYLKSIKASVNLPCLRKDFTIDEYNIYEGRAHGADAILLIVAALDDHQLKDYLSLTEELGMTALIEVHDEEETQRALNNNISLIGINNRNLNTFVTDVRMTEELIPKIPESVQIISESGLDNQDILLKLKDKRVSGFLIGEALMRAPSISDKLKELL